MELRSAEKIINYNKYIAEIEKIRLDYILDKAKMQSNFSYKTSFTKNKKNYRIYLSNLKVLTMYYLQKSLDLFSDYLATIKYMLVLSGSFARNSFREFSDLDISIVLDTKKDDKYIMFEELFYFALSHVFGFPRDRVHSIFINMEDKTKYQSNDVEMKIFWNDNKYSLEYNSRDNTGNDLYMSIKTERVYDTILKDIDYNLNKSVYTEFVYTYQVIFNSLEHNLEKDILKAESKVKTNTDLDIWVKKQNVSYSEQMSSKDLKKLVKSNFINRFNLLCSIIRHHLVLAFNYNKLLDVFDILEGKEAKRLIGKHQKTLRNLYFKYLYYLTRLEICVNKIGSELSNHNNSLIDNERLQSLYKIEYKTNENIFDILFELQSQFEKESTFVIYKCGLK